MNNTILQCLGTNWGKHRSRPPNPGIHRCTRLLVVDNSELGKYANMSGRMAYCIQVYKHGYRAKHMPHATLGDKVLLLLLTPSSFTFRFWLQSRERWRRHSLSGPTLMFTIEKHGIPSTDTNNIVLLDEEEKPIRHSCSCSDSSGVAQETWSTELLESALVGQQVLLGCYCYSDWLNKCNYRKNL